MKYSRRSFFLRIRKALPRASTRPEYSKNRARNALYFRNGGDPPLGHERREQDVPQLKRSMEGARGRRRRRRGSRRPLK